MGRGPAVVVRPANNLSEVKDLIQLTAESFLPEVKGSGLSIAQYVDLEVSLSQLEEHDDKSKPCLCCW